MDEESKKKLKAAFREGYEQGYDSAHCHETENYLDDEFEERWETSETIKSN